MDGKTNAQSASGSSGVSLIQIPYRILVKSTKMEERTSSYAVLSYSSQMTKNLDAEKPYMFTYYNKTGDAYASSQKIYLFSDAEIPEQNIIDQLKKAITIKGDISCKITLPVCGHKLKSEALYVEAQNHRAIITVNDGKISDISIKRPTYSGATSVTPAYFSNTELEFTLCNPTFSDIS